tara:strand:- start:692 stop:874 length:183 start_codon:yes stop_codon:yes gene_type:complete
MQKQTRNTYEDLKVYFISIATVISFRAVLELINFEKITTIISILYVVVLIFINKKFLEND